MNFSGLPFLLLFLPFSLLLYHFVPGKVRKIYLLAISLLFYSWGSLRNLILILLLTGFHYAVGNYLEAEPMERKRQRFVWITVTLDCIILGLYKYTNLHMPLGFSFFFFSALSFVFDIHAKKARITDNPLDLLLYFLFFPKVISGPIVSYKKMIVQIANYKSHSGDVIQGMFLFVFGLFKKILLADILGSHFSVLYSQPYLAGFSALLGVFIYSMQLYFDFSGYSDMACGLALAFGFRFPQNFRYPYLSESLTDFWNRWHISLGQWFREYVYVPLGGNRKGTATTIRNLGIVWLLTGIWHGSTLPFLFWGIYHVCLLILEKFVLSSVLEKLPRMIRILLTDSLAMFGWIFFFTPSIRDSMHYISQIFGADGRGFFDATSFFFLKENSVLVILSILCCGPLVKNLVTLAMQKKKLWINLVLTAVTIVLLLCCFAVCIGATNNAFLYASF